MFLNFLNFFNKEKYLLNYFCTSIVSHCNLNCRYCDHFSPLADKRIFSVQELEKHFKKLRSKIDVQNIGILGGEPLLHPNINEVLIMTRKIFENTNLTIITNGILLNKMPDSFWKCCNQNRVTILISKFPLNIDFSETFDKAKKNKVIVKFYGAEKDKYKDMYKMALDLKGTQDNEEMHRICWQNKGFCNYFQDGKLYKCTTVGNIQNFNNYFKKNLEVTNLDYIDIYKVKNSKEIKKYFENPIPFCKYCNIPQNKDKLPFEISKKEISDWSY